MLAMHQSSLYTNFAAPHQIQVVVEVIQGSGVHG
jgi:hypothetical protein